jgi:dolichol-phosphate mannosyltransferase
VELKSLLERLGVKYIPEVILVDDGSRDRTWALIREYSAADERIKGITLSRNFGHQAALTCGYDHACGEAVIALDADLQDPPEVIEQMLERWEQGADIVYGVRESRDGESIFKLATASLFYRLIGALGARHVRADSGDFRLMSRRSLEALKKLPEYHRFVRGMVGWIGFQTVEIRYARKARMAGETKYTLTKMMRFAMDAIVSFSIMPLRLSYVAAGLISLSVLAFFAYGIVRHLFFGTFLVPGWASLTLTIVAFGTLNLICIGIIGEYIGRIYEQSKNRPVYIVLESSASIPGEATQSRRSERNQSDARGEIRESKLSSQSPTVSQRL